LITLVSIVHVLVCVFLILVILLQAGKGGGMAGAFGGAGAQTVFGGRGAQTLLGKVTSVMAAIFMLTSLTLAYNASSTRSVMDARAKGQPAAPVGSAPVEGAPPAAPAAPGSAPADVPLESPAPGAPAPAPR
jgi:preprotein translocase subunit SecG